MGVLVFALVFAGVLVFCFLVFWYTDQSAAYSSQSPRPLLFNETDIAASVLAEGETNLSIEYNQ